MSMTSVQKTDAFMVEHVWRLQEARVQSVSVQNALQGTDVKVRRVKERGYEYIYITMDGRIV